MVDDAMARGFASFVRWLKTNRRSIEFGIGGLILAGVSYAGWDWYSTKSREDASTSLMVGVRGDFGIVEKKSDEDKDAAPPDDKDKPKDDEVGPRPRFDSYKAMREESLRGYQSAAGRSGPGILARLGEAGVLLDTKDYDGAIRALNEVLATDLAKADESVRMAAKERMGFALEGKGDEAGALAAFKELEGSEIPSYKLYGLYHQGRIALAKGDKEQAKDKLSKVREQLREQLKGKDAMKSGANRYLTAQVDAMLRTIDPSLVPAAMPSLGGGAEMTPERMKELQRQLEKLRKNPPVLDTNPEPPKPPDNAPKPPTTTAPPKPPIAPPQPTTAPPAPAPAGSH
jgi:predicted negative regulator of RcsB-dependent stress response